MSALWKDESCRCRVGAFLRARAARGDSGGHALLGVVLLSVPRRVGVVKVQQNFNVFTKALPSSPYPQCSGTRKRGALCGAPRAQSMPKHRTHMLRLPAGAHGAQVARACARSAHRLVGPNIKLFSLGTRHPGTPLLFLVSPLLQLSVGPHPRTKMRWAKSLCMGAVAVRRSGASRSLVGMRSRVVHCLAHWPSPAALGLALGLGAAGGVAACEKCVPNRALWEAALRGDPREVVQRIDEGAQPDGYVDENGVSALIAAAHQGHAKVVEVLLDEGAAPDQQAPKGSSALMAASGEGHVSVVKVLLDGGANPDLLNANGVSALIWACTKGNLEVVNVLLERGAKVNHQDKGGVTALMAASVLGHFDVVKVLLEHGARTDLKDSASRTALDFAQRKAASKMEARKTLQKEATARLLLEHGAKSG